MRERFSSYLAPLLGIILFGAALWVLHRALEQYHYHEIIGSLSRIPGTRLAAAVAVTFLNYLVLTGYDLLSFRYIGRTLPYPKIALASFIGYAFSNNAGFAMLAGSSVRYRLYSAWGITALEITKVVAFYTVTLWLGLCAVAAGVFLTNPIDLPQWLHLPFSSVRPIGLLLLLPLIGYLTAAILKKKPVSIRGWQLPIPPLGLSVLQIIVSGLDWTLAAGVLFILLEPTTSLPFSTFLTVFLLAQISGLLSQVPGGLGVFESVVVMGLTPILPAYSVLASLLAYRLVYYLIPLVVAVVLLGLHELLALRSGIARAARIFGEWAPVMAPPAFAFLAFISGVVLLASGATPGVDWRMEVLRSSVPLPVVEFSHFLGSVIGVVLLLLARGLQLRLDAAYFLSVLLLGIGVIASLLKGLDYEEATVLGAVMLLLLPTRRHFYRKASLFAEPFNSGWIASVGIAMMGSLWLGFFSFKHVEYSGDLWWTFAFSENAPRTLRAMVGAVMTCFIIAALRLLRPAPPRSDPISDAADQDRVQAIVRLSRSSSANLALLGDKRFLFSGSGRSFIMYGIEGRSWVAMGDPVGVRDEWQELIWEYREMCDRYGGWTVFYEVGKENLPLYLDLGLTPQKIGEEARVLLKNFSLEGKSRKSFRNICNGFARDGFSFEIVAVDQVEALIPALKTISDAWLAEKNCREKRFSLGYFNPAYLQHFPVGIVRKDTAVFAFCNIWESAEKEELSIDLMRYLPSAPRDTMEYLLLQLLLWGKAQGYQWFNLGMAPFSGLEGRALAPAWQRLGALMYQHGEHFYNFLGLRRYKEKFDPHWEPRYLVCPRGLVLPRVLANIASLVSGGMKGVVSK